MTTRVDGTVKWFNEKKGFGFIKPDGGGVDMFVHVSALKRANMSELREGDRISYEVGHNDRSNKPCAVNLQVGTGPAGLVLDVA